MSSRSESPDLQGAAEGAPSASATFVLLPGAGGDSWYWHLVAPRLHARGHEVLSPNLPADDDAAGLGEYADTVVEVIGDRAGLVVVAQSMAAFIAPMLCDRVDVQLLILVAPMHLASRSARGGQAPARQSHGGATTKGKAAIPTQASM